MNLIWNYPSKETSQLKEIKILIKPAVNLYSRLTSNLKNYRKIDYLLSLSIKKELFQIKAIGLLFNQILPTKLMITVISFSNIIINNLIPTILNCSLL